MKEISQSYVLDARSVILTSSALAARNALAAWNSRVVAIVPPNPREQP
jgi:hypothetical protein